MIVTELTERLGIRHPILLAPMGGVAGGRLAAAVSAAGGLGLVGGGYAHPDPLVAELTLAGDARIGVGFITFALGKRPDSLRIALEREPVAIQLSFGDPTAYVEQIKSAGALLISQVQTVAEARQAARAGADLIIAQGQDSGGHGRPGQGTIGLVPAVVDAVDPVPVVAAGGIADGRGLAAALALGATGITLGTRFYAAEEALSDAAAKRLLVESTGADTQRTPAFDALRGPAWPAGYDGRALRNTTMDQWPEAAGDDERRARLSAAYRSAPEDDYTVKALWAGEGLDLIREIAPVAEIVTRLVAQAEQIVSNAPLRR